jgi:hypothetical protein
VTTADDLLLGHEPLAPRDLDLHPHEVEPGDHLRHRVLHLQARVHLEEVEIAPRVHEELDRAGAAVAHGLRRAHGHLAHRRAQPLVENAARALLDDLLLAALHRALALPEVDGVPVLVGEHLDLDVARLVENFSR